MIDPTMQRRKLVRLAAAALLAGRGVAQAQGRATKQPVGIGFVGSVPFATWPLRAAFAEAMRERGWVEGVHYAMHAVSYEGRGERIPIVAAELVQRRPDVIVAGGTPPVAALMRLTSTIPIVFVGAVDPVADGFVASIARPGGNVTGLGGLGQGVLTKQLELLTRAAPRAERIGIVFNPDLRAHATGRLEVDAAAAGLGVQLRPVALRAPDEIAAAARALLRERVDAVHFFAQPFFNAHRHRLAALALEHRWPAVSGFEEDARAGILLFYGARLEDAVRRVPYYLDRILTGTPPAELPVEQPSRFYLTMNLKTARALGLALPRSLLMQATEVIE
jgi:putative tryptophan/tyrosine transport system substrate-binding protein